MEHYVQYHNSEAMGLSCLEFTPEDGYRIATSKPVSNLLGNRIWLIGGIDRPRKYYLCYYFIADETEPAEPDSYFKHYVSGQEGALFQPPIYLNDKLWFIEFRKSQQNFSLGVRKIEARFVDELDKLVNDYETESDPNKRLQKTLDNKGAGFGNPETNQKVEQAAIAYVTNYYQENGWNVESVETDKSGFDLLCKRTSRVEHVEVKGIQGDGVSFIMTANEFEYAKANDNFVLCAVTKALSDNPQMYRYNSKEFLASFRLEPISYRASLIGKK